MKEIQIYEVENTNLLFVVTDRNSDASYYSKSNLKVEAVDGYVVMWNEGVQFFRELPRDFVNPLESSVVDLVEIIQGYINNIISEEDEKLTALEDIIKQNEERNLLISSLIENNSVMQDMLNELKKVTFLLQGISK